MVLSEFGQWISSLSSTELPGTTIRHGARVFVDWLAAAVVGGRLEPASLLGTALLGCGEAGHSLVIPGGQRAPARTAALLNATAAHTAEVDDIFAPGIYHPGAPTIAAALAVAQDRDLSGAAFVRGVVAGYEVGTRIAAAVQPAHYRYWHTTGTIGTVGAAAAAASLLRLDPDAATHALATATTLAAGLQQAIRSDSMSKPLHAGHAAETGVLAALAAEHGVTGAADALTGPVGLGAATAESPDLDHAAQGLGQRWNITAVSVKAHAGCGHTFAAIDATLDLLAQHALPSRQIDRIRVETAEVPAAVAGHREPRSPVEAKFSISYAVAAAAVLGDVQLSAFEPPALSDVRIRSLMRKVDIIVDPQLSAVFPVWRAARVSVLTTDGRTLTVQRLTRKGDPGDPLSDDDVQAKFTALVSPVLGTSRTAELAKTAWAVHDLPSVRELPATEEVP